MYIIVEHIYNKLFKQLSTTGSSSNTNNLIIIII